MRTQIYLALVHYPVYNKRRDIVCTSVTNFDIHDISRTSSTYDVKAYRIVVPVEAQKKLTERILSYWHEGIGGDYNKDRKEAFMRTKVVNSIEELIQEIEDEEGKKPKIITTSARIFPKSISFQALQEKIFQEQEQPYLLLFGTGWGLTDEVMEKSDYILEPIRGQAKYNHLSVRAAVAIVLDRLLGED